MANEVVETRTRYSFVVPFTSYKQMAGEQALLEELARLKKENESLRRQLGASGNVKTLPAAAAKIEALDNRQIERFSRQLLLKEVGVKGLYQLMFVDWIPNLTCMWTGL